jgi:hypothetical protein
MTENLVTTPRITRKAARLLNALYAVHIIRSVDHPDWGVENKNWHMNNVDLAKAAKLRLFTFYPLIELFHDNGWVEREREQVPEGVNRAPHTYYHLTEKGFSVAKASNVRAARRSAIWMWIKRAINRRRS